MSETDGAAFGFTGASWGARAGALILDGLVVAAAGVGIGLVAYLIAGDASYIETGVDADGVPYRDEVPYAVLVGGIALFAGLLLYPWIMLGATKGRSVGRMATHIRVVTYDGRPVGYGRAFVRELIMKTLLGFFTIPLLLSYLWPLWEKHQRALHDLMISTRVVKDTGERPADPAPTELRGFATPAATGDAASWVPPSSSSPPPPPAPPAPPSPASGRQLEDRERDL